MPAPLTVFIHVPKAAGSAFRSVITKNVPPSLRVPIYRIGNTPLQEISETLSPALESAAIVFGHFEARMHELVDREVRYFTILRDPAHRVLSLYKYIKYDFSAHPMHARFNDGVSLAGWLATDPPTASNVMTKLLSGRPTSEAATPGDLEVAIERLEAMPVFGIQELYNESVLTICDTFGWSPVFETRNRSSLTNRDFRAKEGIGEPVMEEIARLNELDRSLYDQAVGLFEDRRRARRDAARRKGFRNGASMTSALRHWDGFPHAFADRSQHIQRLDERYKRIVEANRDAFERKTVLDLACNNGRWSYAALQAGAATVIGVEGRPEKAAEAAWILEGLGADGRYEFATGDMFDWLFLNGDRPVDTILCLGVFYHIMDHHRLLDLMARTGASTIIIDSGFVRSFRNSVHVQTEDPGRHMNALPKYQGQKAEFAGFVSLGLMIQMAWNLGFSCRPVVWRPEEIANRDCVQDYMMGRRFTVRLDRTGLHEDAEWRTHWREALVALDARFEALLDRETHDALTDDRVRRPFVSAGFSIM